MASLNHTINDTTASLGSYLQKKIDHHIIYFISGDWFVDQFNYCQSETVIFVYTNFELTTGAFFLCSFFLLLFIIAFCCYYAGNCAWCALNGENKTYCT